VSLTVTTIVASNAATARATIKGRRDFRVRSGGTLAGGETKPSSLSWVTYSPEPAPSGAKRVLYGLISAGGHRFGEKRAALAQKLSRIAAW